MSDKNARPERSDGYAKIILKENSASFAKWDVPDVDEGEKIEQEDELFPMLTAEQLEEIHQQALDEGYEEGLKKGFDEGSHNGFEEGKTLGYKQAYDLAKDEIKLKAEQMHALLSSIEKPFLHTVKELEDEVQQLAFVIAKHIIRQEIKASPEYIQTLVAQSIALLPSSNKVIKIYCHPQDLTLIEDYFSSLDDADKIEHKLIKDPSMQAGGVRIDSDTSYIDESLETRFIKLEETFEQMRHDEHHDKEGGEDTDETIASQQNTESILEPQNAPSQAENLFDDEVIIEDEAVIDDEGFVADNAESIIDDVIEYQAEQLQKPEN